MNSKKMILEQLNAVKYIDFHIHLEEFSREQLSYNVLYLANSIDEETYKTTMELAEQSKNVIPLFGIHPVKCAHNNTPETLLEEIFRKSALVGETGMDFYWIQDRSTDSFQRKKFRLQMQLCSKYNCVPIIHTKGAEEEVLDILKEYGISRSVIHWYSGPDKLIPGYLEAGAYFTIGPDILEGSTTWRHIPPDRMFAETDNPTGIKSILERDAQSDDILLVYNKLAEIMAYSVDELANLFKENLRNLLDWS